MGYPTKHIVVSRFLQQEVCQRFWSRVDKTTDCWAWNGRRNIYGYGIFGLGKISYFAHRISYATANNEDPGIFMVCHKCDNRPCVNPAHLYKGTVQDNANDRESRGRSVRRLAEDHGNSKLTNAQVEELRTIYAAGGITIYHLADLYCISPQSVSDIVRGNLYKSVSGPISQHNFKNDGERNPRAKLTAADVDEIRRVFNQTKCKHGDLARLFNVSRCTVRDIVTFRTWAGDNE